MMLNAITDSAQRRTLSQAVREIIRSLDGDTPSATFVIKVTSQDLDARNIDLFTEAIVRSNNGLLKLPILDNDQERI